jgi:hypothetical protein
VHVQVQNRVAAAIALSLPGASKLLPFLHDIAAAYAAPGKPLATPFTHAALAKGPSANLHFRTKGIPFLHSYPHWLEQHHVQHASHKHAASSKQASLDVLDKQRDGPATQMDTIRVPHTTHKLDDSSDDEQLDARTWHGGEPHVVAEETIRGTAMQHLSDGARATHLSDVCTALVATSDAEAEMSGVIAELLTTGGTSALAQSAVARTLMGAFGRLERREAEAFLQMRTVRHC